MAPRFEFIPTVSGAGDSVSLSPAWLPWANLDYVVARLFVQRPNAAQPPVSTAFVLGPEILIDVEHCLQILQMFI